MVKEYTKFIDALSESRSCAWLAAEWLMGIGYDVKILPGTTTPNEEERFQHVDLGDIEIAQRIEVKYWPDIDFSSLGDVPYDNIIVDEAYKIDKFNIATLYGYLILNASKTACLLISARTKEHWFRKEVFDRKENSKRTFMFCPKEKVICRML